MPQAMHVAGGLGGVRAGDTSGLGARRMLASSSGPACTITARPPIAFVDTSGREPHISRPVGEHQDRREVRRGGHTENVVGIRELTGKGVDVTLGPVGGIGQLWRSVRKPKSAASAESSSSTSPGSDPCVLTVRRRSSRSPEVGRDADDRQVAGAGVEQHRRCAAQKDDPRGVGAPAAHGHQIC